MRLQLFAQSASKPVHVEPGLAEPGSQRRVPLYLQLRPMVHLFRTAAFGLALPSHSLAATLLASDGIKIKEAFHIFLQQRIERQRVQRAVRRYDQGRDPGEAILQGRYQLVIGKPSQFWQ